MKINRLCKHLQMWIMWVLLCLYAWNVIYITEMGVTLIFRIAGDTALCKNIHESVSRQMRKNFAKSKWRVSVIRWNRYITTKKTYGYISWVQSQVSHFVCFLPVFAASLQCHGCDSPHEAPAAGHQLWWWQRSQLLPTEPRSSQEPVHGLHPALPEGL